MGKHPRVVRHVHDCAAGCTLVEPLRSERERQGSCPIGAVLEDRSPFGVLDLAGNVSEWTSDAICPWSVPLDEKVPEKVPEKAADSSAPKAPEKP